MNLENLKQIKLLMEYDTSLTKDENLDKIKSFSPGIIKEVTLPSFLGSVVRSEIDDVLKSMSKSGTKLKTVDDIIVGSADDLDRVIANANKMKKAPFSPQMLGTLRANLMRSPNVSLASKSRAIDDLIKGQSFLSRYGNSSYDDIVKAMKKKGNAFPDDVAEEIAKKHTKGSAGTVGGSGKNTVGGSSKTTVKNTAGGSKTTVKNTSNVKNTAAKNTATKLKKNPKIVKKVNSFKGGKDWNWRKISAWALGLGITGAAIWYFIKDSGDPLPVDFPTTPPVDEGGGGGGGGSNTGGGTGGTKYTSCPETFPISQNCKNNKIKEIQACLSMPAKYQTGNFGTITQGYLERAGVSGTEITQDSYDKVCNKTTTTSTPFEDDEDEDTDLNQTSTTSTTTSTTSTDDEEEA